MSKLSYTWYPKDWNNSEAVFCLNLEQRGLYRELIDLAMLNDNKTIINYSVWCRKFDISKENLVLLLSKLMEFDLIVINDKSLTIPSCEPRLNLCRGGKKGGENKPTIKPISKPTIKPIPKQKKEKEKKVNIKEFETEEYKKQLVEFFNTKIVEHNLEVKPVIDELKCAYDYYKDNDWKNSNNKNVVNLKSTIWNNWFKNKLNEFPKKKPNPITTSLYD